MTIIYRLLAVASAAFFIACNPVLAQWQIPTNSIPVGRGQGSGFGFATPGALGTCLLSNGPSSAPTFGACATGSAGIDTNTLNAQSGNYSIVSGDAGKTIYVTGGPFTVTLPAVTGFAPTAVVNVCNGNPNSVAGRAVRLSGFPDPLPPRLYMQQCLQVAIENGVWAAKDVPGRFRPTFTPRLYLDTTNGNDANDGFVSNASGNALRNLGTCFSIFNNEYDMRSLQPICSLTAGQTFVGSVALIGMQSGSSVYNVEGNGGLAIVRATATSGTSAMFLGDFAPYVISTNIRWDCAGAAANCAGIDLHQQTGIDFNAGSELLGNGVGHVGIRCDSMCKVNAGSTVILTGTFAYGIQATQGSMFNLTSGITLTASSSIQTAFVNLGGLSHLLMSGTLTMGAGASANGADFFQLRGGSQACISITSVSGTWTGMRQWSVYNNSLLANLSATAVPGTVSGVNTAGTLANGIIVNSGVSAGGC